MAPPCASHIVGAHAVAVAFTASSPGKWETRPDGAGLSLDARDGTGEPQKGKGHCRSSTVVYVWHGGHGEPAGRRAGRNLWPGRRCRSWEVVVTEEGEEPREM